MKAEHDSSDGKAFVAKAVEASIRIAIIGVLAVYCYHIVAPFILPVVWGIIIAVAAYPIQKKLETLFGGRKGLAASTVTLLMLLILLVPAAFLIQTLVTGIRGLAEGIREGTLSVPPPPASVETWPIIGKQVAGLWALAAVNLEKVLLQYRPELAQAGKWLVSLAGEIGMAILMFFISVVVAGVLLAYAEGGINVANKFAARLVGVQGEEFVRVAGLTVRSVFRGILGVAFIQSTLAGLLFWVAGIPFAGLWTFVCLLLGVMQIGALPILIPAVVYMFATAETLPAILFLGGAIVVGVSDNVVKPFLMGRGVDTPMIVVLIGSIGGLIVSGVVGLFVGAVVLTLAYRLFLVWLEESV